jgi:GPI-anchor transamidase subunit K
MLFMIDTCQANTMYSKFYSPNIIATGSSELDESSYSHHADNDVGVAVIDRYTYYNLDFLETEVLEPTSKKTIGDLFGSYDESKIHSRPGVRYDLFDGGEQAAKERLVMDFFGNVQNVELESAQGFNDSQWREDLRQLEALVLAAQARHMMQNDTGSESLGAVPVAASSGWQPVDDAMRMDSERSWSKNFAGVGILAACAGAWLAAGWVDSKHGK